MINFHPEVVVRRGVRYVILPYKEFCYISELIEDVQDIIDLDSARRKARNKKSISLNQVKKKLRLA